MFLVVEAIALAFFLGRADGQWFHADEWDFLVTRSAGDLDDLFRPHNEHWSTLPILFYRVMWSLIGLRSYIPYVVIAILLHLAAAALLRVVMVRAGVGAWMATLVASVLVLFGAGHANIVWPFMIAFVAPLVFGLCHLLLADHDGPFDRRDVIGVACGLAALLCSGIGVTMVFVVAVAVLLRRGWRAATLHAAPLAAVYAVWYIAFASDAYDGSAGVGHVVRWIGRGSWATVRELGHTTVMGIALASLLAVGLPLAWRPLPRVARRRHAAAPVALLLGALFFLVLTGVGRATAVHALDGQPQSPDTSRYLHVLAALTLPSLAVAADAVTRRGRVATVAVVIILVAGVPGNLRVFTDAMEGPGTAYQAVVRDDILAVAHDPLLRGLPPAARPRFFLTRHITVGWLRNGAANGRIPRPVRPTSQAAAIIGPLVLVSSEPASAAGCETLRVPATAQLQRGDSLVAEQGSAGVTFVLTTEQQGAARADRLLGSTVGVDSRGGRDHRPRRTEIGPLADLGLPRAARVIGTRTPSRAPRREPPVDVVEVLQGERVARPVVERERQSELGTTSNRQALRS